MKNTVFLIILLISTGVFAGKADVLEVKVNCADSCTFQVTVQHADSGWDHYANEWQVVSADDGSILGTRVLYHPHVNEQPFTRTLSAVRIPANLKQIIVKAKDTVHGYGGLEQTVTLPLH